MRKLFIGCYNRSIILTYVGMVCSLFGIFILFADIEPPISNLNISMIALVLAGVCDMFDGMVARKCKRTDKEKLFGIQLDSLVDTVSFVVFPAIFLLNICEFHSLSLIIACFYVFAGVMRLGWFNVITEETKGFYYGLPVTLSSMFFPLLYIITLAVKVEDRYNTAIYCVAFALTAFLFILNFRLRKPKIRGAVCMGMMAVVAVILLILM